MTNISNVLQTVRVLGLLTNVYFLVSNRLTQISDVL
jgi:hypothetical protein